MDEVTHIRLVDHDVKPGVESDMGDGDAWPAIREQILASEILIVATPTWLGQISSVTKRALERMDALLSETDDAGVPVAYNQVAGVVVTGNEDGAHAMHRRRRPGAHRHRLHLPRPGLDLLEQGPGARRGGVPLHPREGLDPLHRRGRRPQPRRGRPRPAGQPDPQAAERLRACAARGPHASSSSSGRASSPTDSGELRADVLGAVCDEVAARHPAGDDVVVVTSGAIARGMRVMELAMRPSAIEDLQAASAVGQGKLYRVYDELLRERGVTTAQVLLTFFDLSARTHYLNARRTLGGCSSGASSRSSTRTTRRRPTTSPSATTTSSPRRWRS